MKPVDIRIALLRKGVTNVQVANDLGLSPKTVSNVIRGHGYSSRVARRLSEVTGIPVARLFPGRGQRVAA
ncbi:helix-turn-helix domain-containing protein [Algiphilus sp.]|uniref:helix-turn-helix domain-containing protein n=1 Tax=Algiphilus sp. TaxID=1872431 RepID=UPI003453D374